MSVVAGYACQLHATDQLQPLLAGFGWSALVPLQLLWELPAPGFSPLQAVLLVAQLVMVKAEPAIRLAMQKPARTFLSSLLSIICLPSVKRYGPYRFSPGVGKPGCMVIDKSQRVLKDKRTDIFYPRYVVELIISISRSPHLSNRFSEGHHDVIRSLQRSRGLLPAAADFRPP